MIEQQAAPPYSSAQYAVGAATLGAAGAGWVSALRLMHGMGGGTATELGSLASFSAVWASMMAAMMLPGAVPAVVRSVQAGDRYHAPLFVASYLAIWALVGLAVYAADRPHGTSAAAAIVLAAGVYELTPLKRNLRKRCRADVGSGLEFGLCCFGSSVGLMAILAAIGLMNVTWMAVITVVVLTQKLLPPKAAVDVPLALVIVGIGVAIAVTPSSIPGLLPAM